MSRTGTSTAPTSAASRQVSTFTDAEGWYPGIERRANGGYAFRGAVVMS